MAKVILKNVRGAFLSVFEPKAFGADGGKPAYSGLFLFEPGSENHDALKKAIKDAAAEKWGAKAGYILKSLNAQNKLCLHSGDEKPQCDGFEGVMFVSARNDAQPEVLDKHKNRLTEAEGKVYSGAYYNVSLDVWAQDNGYVKRVNATLLGIQFCADGAAFGSSRPGGGSEFEAFESDGDAYQRKVSPTAQADNPLVKDPDACGDTARLVIQLTGKPAVAPESDKRKAIGSVADDFEADALRDPACSNSIDDLL